MFEVSVIIPTFNEADNILKVIHQIESNLDGCNYEIIVVDDNSPDGTSEIVKNYTKINNRIFCIKRTWKKGLSSAVVEGVGLASKRHICVMDGDGQHNPENIKNFISCIQDNDIDLVSGSRFLLAPNVEGLSKSRHELSQTGIKVTNFFLENDISDPLSGFFLMKRDKFLELQGSLYKDGFKILFDMLMLDKTLKHKEIAIDFRDRISGDSKLNISTLFNLIGQIIENISRGLIPANFVVFSFVGTLGVFVHLLILSILLALGGPFILSNGLSTILAMSSNYLLNNYLTFHNLHRLISERIKGFLKYCFVNSFSIFANIGIASQFYLNEFSAITSALFGIIAGLVLNYFLSVNLVFKK